MSVYKPHDKRIHAFLLWLLYDEKLKEAVAKEYARTVENFGLYLEPNLKGSSFSLLHETTPTDVRSYLDHLTRECKYSGATIRRKMSFLRKYFQYEKDKDNRRDDPTEGVPVPARPPRNPKNLLPDEIERLFKVVREMPGTLGIRDFAILHALYSGLNKSELVNLRFTDFDARTGTVHTSQSRKPRKLRLKAAAAEAFNAYRAVRGKGKGDAFFLTNGGRGISARQVWSRIKIAGKLAGLGKRLTPSLLRDSFAIHTLMDDPAAVMLVKEAFGHRSLHNTQALLEKALELRRAQEDAIALSGPSDDLFDLVDIRKAKRQWHKAKQRLANDPDGAITLTRSLLETIAKTVLKRAGEQCDGLELAPLCRRAVAAVLPASVVGRENFSKFAQSAANLVDNIRGYRNSVGDAHGSTEEAEIERHHAEYAVSLAGATATFLLECYATGAKGKAQGPKIA